MSSPFGLLHWSGRLEASRGAANLDDRAGSLRTFTAQLTQQRTHAVGDVRAPDVIWSAANGFRTASAPPAPLSLAAGAFPVRSELALPRPTSTPTQEAVVGAPLVDTETDRDIINDDTDDICADIQADGDADMKILSATDEIMNVDGVDGRECIRSHSVRTGSPVAARRARALCDSSCVALAAMPTTPAPATPLPRPAAFPLHLFRPSVAETVPPLDVLVPARNRPEARRHAVAAPSITADESDMPHVVSPRWSLAGPAQLANGSRTIGDACARYRIAPAAAASAAVAVAIRKSPTFSTDAPLQDNDKQSGAIELLDDASSNRFHTLTRLIDNERTRKRFEAYIASIDDVTVASANVPAAVPSPPRLFKHVRVVCSTSPPSHATTESLLLPPLRRAPTATVPPPPLKSTRAPLCSPPSQLRRESDLLQAASIGRMAVDWADIYAPSSSILALASGSARDTTTPHVRRNVVSVPQSFPTYFRK